MKGGAATWVGADPGGKQSFGIALLRDGAAPKVEVVDCADEAVTFVLRHISAAPKGVGIDAPLWWSSGPSSDRFADQWLRAEYGLSGGQVQTANSLRGAALVQAAMFIQRLRENFPEVPVTEVHPKALLTSGVCGAWPEFSERYGIDAGSPNEHERDSLIAAVAAREGFEKRWSRDLSTTREASEQDPQKYWLAPVHYFWPGP